MSRCCICNWTDFSAGDCLDQSEDFPGRNAVHYRKAIKEDVCNYCFQQIQANRRFYHAYFSNIDKEKEKWGGIADALAKAKGVNDSNKRPKQDNKKKVLALPKSKLQVE